ncbi:SpoIIE family protein phosphatase [Desulfococcaceae bacterium HSG8]|nr:SpoIIE family protein phosphatase [Desulfococcaceae bacterium HSG8]
MLRIMLLNWLKTLKVRLYMAFFVISLLILFSTGVALYSFNQLGKVTDNTTGKTVPEMIAAMRLSERSALLAATAPVLITSENEEEVLRTEERITELIDDINEGVYFLAKQGSGTDEELIFRISMNSEAIAENLYHLNRDTRRQLVLKARLRSLLTEIRKLHNDLVDTVSPLLYGTSSLTSLFGKRAARRSISSVKKLLKSDDKDASYKETSKLIRKSISELTDSAMKEMGYASDIKAEGNLLVSLLITASDVDRMETLTDLHSRFKQSFSSFRHAAAVFRKGALAQRNPILAGNVDEIDKRIAAFDEGESSIFEIQREVISNNRHISKELSGAHRVATNMTKEINRLVAGVQADLNRLHTDTSENTKASRFILIVICGGCLLSSALIAYFTVSILSRHERNIIAAKEKAEIARKAAEAANEKIVDSLEYAQMIQKALLPNPEIIKTYLPDSFFLWMPRDIVGGDIFFTDTFEDGFVISVIDCTGHGVPGAFLTMIAYSALVRVIKDEACHDPAEVLKRLNFIVKTTLHQDTEETSSDDGLDAGLCFVNLKEKILTFAGAMIPLIYINDGKLNVIKGNKRSIGYRRSDLDADFTKHTISIRKEMRFYLASDGFHDQMGKNERSRFGRSSFGNKRFKELLRENSNLPFRDQQAVLVEVFNKHKGNIERQDDVTVVGFSLKPET